VPEEAGGQVEKGLAGTARVRVERGMVMEVREVEQVLVDLYRWR
jgi:hypothetical protein